MAVNAADKSVLVHYQGWHTKWDEWISTNTDRFRTARFTVIRKESQSAQSRLDTGTTGRKEAGRAVRQVARVLQLARQTIGEDGTRRWRAVRVIARMW